MKILLIEDDELTAKALTEVLINQHYVVDVAYDGQVAWELVETFNYDLVLLDVILPKLDGISLCKRLRSHQYQMPIMLLTARSSSTDKVMGLDAGADDYVIKPFDIQELLARIRVLLRRGGSSLSPILEWENLRLNPNNYEATYAEKILNLTPKEYRLLELFLRNSNRVFSRSAILDHLWSLDESPNEGTVTAHIMGLRHKLKAAGAASDFIETVYGLGYRLKSPGTETHKTPTRTHKNKKAQVKEQTLASVSQVWEQFKDKVQDRLKIFEQVAIAFSQDNLSEELRQQAIQEAHRLAGSLGIFGFIQGSQLAREIEKLLQPTEILDSPQIKHLSDLVSNLRQELVKDPQQDHLKSSSNDNSAVVLMIDDDAQLAERMQIEAKSWGINLEIATDLFSARKKLAQYSPDGVMLDLTLADTAEDGFTLLAELTHRTPPIPVLVFTASNSFSDRLEVARLGGRAFLQKSMPPTQVLEAVTQMLNQGRSAEAKVIIVDNDRDVLFNLRNLLEPWGLKVIAIDQPRHFWQVLEQSAPDLIIFGQDMPDISGIELCQVIRNEMRWSELPVIMLTNHTDADTIHQIFMAGADDYVNKPIIGPELVTRVIGRLERYTLRRSQLAHRHTQG